MRSFSGFVLVVLATLLAPLVVTTTWVGARIDDREEYVATVAPLADDPAVRKVMADAAAAEAVATLQRYVPVGLPQAVTTWANAAAEKVVESPDFPEFWRKANEDVHRDVLAILRDPDASADGWLTVDARPLLAQVLLTLEERGIPVGLLPPVPLDVRVVERAKIVEAGPAYRATDGIARWLPLGWLVLVALAVVVVAGWRARVRTVGLALLGLALGAVVVLLAADPVADAAVDRAEVTGQPLVRVMMDTVLGSLTPWARTFLLAVPAGAVLLAASWWPRRDREPEPAPSYDEVPLHR